MSNLRWGRDLMVHATNEDVSLDSGREVGPRHVPGGVDSRLLTTAAERLNRGLNAALHSDELTSDQWHVLGYLDVEGPCTMSTLAGATGISGPTLTRIVDRLVSSALTYRSAGPNDRRQVLVYLSDRGRHTTRRLRSVVEEFENQVLVHLDRNERDELTRLLRRALSSDEAGEISA